MQGFESLRIRVRYFSLEESLDPHFAQAGEGVPKRKTNCLPEERISCL